MQGSDSPPPVERRRPPPFRPRFSIGIVYLAAFFVTFQFLQVLPGLIELLQIMEAGPEQQLAAQDVMRDGSSPLLSVVLSLGATALGSYYRLLPGMRT